MEEGVKNNFNKRKYFKLEHWHFIALFLLLYDIFAVNGSYFLALWLRFDLKFSGISNNYLNAWKQFIPVYTVICIVIFLSMKIYSSIWRFASFNELARLLIANFIACVLHITFISLFFERMPISYYLMGSIIQFILVIGIRFSYRFVLLERRRHNRLSREENAKRVMLIGAGSSGQMILKDLKHSDQVDAKVCCIIDDNPNKKGRYIDGVPIVGNREDILSNVKKYNIDTIFMAIPSAKAEDKRDIINICSATDCELKNLPGIYQLAKGEITVSAMKNVEVEDLLGREPIKVNMDEIYDFLSGKVILVTGGGGSIGSELCRQIAKHGPKLLIIFDVYENNAYSIQLELKDKYPNLNLEVLIGSVRDSSRINYVFEKYKPEIVFHAAAHKHVPLMEDSPCESIKNNVFGTYKTAYAAMANGCKRFVLISTDKAVNPTNIMGASKRLCEMVIQSFNSCIKEGRTKDLPVFYIRKENFQESMIKKEFLEEPKTEFVAVRFGNVLGSNGSVIPLFKKQIASGGPVTVTHPDIIRYFMTIPEAASLVLEAGTYAKGGEIFVLDMGSPVKIDTLARNLIKLSGFKPDIDIKIKYTGLRPGEKLYEEKLMAEEGLRKTPNDLIHIGSPIPFDVNEFMEQLQTLLLASYEEKTENIRYIVADIIKTYKIV